MLSALDQVMNELLNQPMLLAGMGLLSLLMFFSTLFVMPYLVLKIPSDYFLHEKAARLPWQDEHPAIRFFLLVLKNLAGVFLLLAGMAMLLLPGQGLLTILLAVILLDFPGKYRLKLWLVKRPRVLKSMNWLRRRYGKSPLQVAKKQRTQV